MSPTDTRARLSEGLAVLEHPTHPVTKLNKALHACIHSERLEKMIRDAEKCGTIPSGPLAQQVIAAIEHNVITEAEGEIVLNADSLRAEVIAVDDFDHGELARPKSQHAMTLASKSKLNMVEPIVEKAVS